MAPSKIICVAALFASASAFQPMPSARLSTAIFNVEKGAGGMADTRNPDALQHDDARKSISAAPSFEEYMKQRDGAAAAPAPAPAAAAPAPAAVPAPAAAAPAATGGAPAKGAGGMADTRDPEPIQHEDARKSISAAPSFEEYMKQRGQ